MLRAVQRVAFPAAWASLCTLGGMAAWAGVVRGGGDVWQANADGERWKTKRLPANPQRPGSPEAGYEYLLYGDYIGSGIPADLFRGLAAGMPSAEPLIEREGLAAGLPHELSAFTMPSGAEVIAAVNCLGCHAQVLNGELIVGLGNSLGDWTGDAGLPLEAVGAAVRLIYPAEHPGRVAAEQFLRGAKALDGKVAAPFRGVNPAFRLEEVAAAHRDPQTLEWSANPVYEYADRVVTSDVPAWWNVKKKNALYYTGLGRGDFSKLIQQVNVVAIGDAEDAARINASMGDLLAYLMTIEPPMYPSPIDHGLANAGAVVFEQNCASCHGTYGDEWTYPNKLVSLDEIGTDPVYAKALAESGLHEWFNESWYATSEPTARAEPGLGYVAPPLDGVWATAPYLHNGSVPTLAGVLESSERPRYWRRSFVEPEYNIEAPGWVHTAEAGPADASTYNTTLPGYSNTGHEYGDDLTPEERRAVLEYLKTL